MKKSVIWRLCIMLPVLTGAFACGGGDNSAADSTGALNTAGNMEMSSAVPGDSSMPAGMDHSAHGGAPIVIPKGARYNAADVHFMQGMIAHHGQAVAMTDLAKTHGVSADLLRFAQKIDLSQSAEIEMMQWWLKDRNQAAPDASSYKTMMMPGMLTAEQLKQLESARGKEFERLFLTLMIQHHEGALSMVADLFADPLAAQDAQLSAFASDVDTDQRAEIARMYVMLENL